MADISSYISMATAIAESLVEAQEGAASTTSSSTPTTSADRIASLISGAESLISTQYPGVTPTNLATLTWPATVVIDGETLTVPVTSTYSPSSTAASTSPSSAAAQATSAASSASPTSSHKSSSKSDLPVGAIAGGVLGAIAFLVLFGAIFFLYRRRRRTGSFFRHQPPPNDEEIEAWKGPESHWQGSSSSHIWADKDRYKPVAGEAVPVAAVGASANRDVRPAYLEEGHNSSSSSSGRNGYYTPNSTRAELAGNHSRQNSYEHTPLTGNVQPVGQTRSGRPQTPLMHDMMHNTHDNNGPASPISPVGHPQQGYSHNNTNPFASPEDDGAEMEPPWIPARSPERRHSPRVHYPSGPEVSGFDFGLSPQARALIARQQQGQHGGYEDGGDGWKRPPVRGGQ